MTWDRSIAATIALTNCVHCRGRGLRWQDQPCRCLLRAVFRQCYARFRREAVGRFRRPSLYACDFALVGQRSLADPLEHARELGVFKLHFLLGADWKLCCRQLGIDRGTFFHAMYHCEALLGRAYAELKPYPLWPVAEYFTLRLPDGVRPCQVPAVRRDACIPLRPPLAPQRQPVVCPSPAWEPLVPVPVVIDPKVFARARFRDDGATTRTIAADLTRRNIPAPNGANRWGQADVRRLLLAA